MGDFLFYPEFHERAANIHTLERYLCDDMNKALRGKKCIINIDWNGQPYGRSRPSLKGKTFEIDDVSPWNGEIYVSFTEWFPTTIQLKDITVLEKS